MDLLYTTVLRVLQVLRVPLEVPGVQGLAPGVLRVRGLALIGYYPSGLSGFAAFAGVVAFVG